jgi:hypothetical protein
VHHGDLAARDLGVLNVVVAALLGARERGDLVLLQREWGVRVGERRAEERKAREAGSGGRG